MKNFGVFIALFLFAVPVFAQNLVVSGTVQSNADKTTVPMANVVLKSVKDSSIVTGATSDFNGKFRIAGVKPGSYLLNIQFIGYKPLMQKITVTKSVNVGTLGLDEETSALEEVVVTAEAASGVQKGDTSQFNALAFKTMPDASSQDLVSKIPGVTLIDGKLQAQGEDVQEIYVDGKPFFGGSVQQALESLPADVVASVQIYDKKSDKAQLSGFDDGETTKVINIITKPGRRKGQFGKSTVGYGNDKRYLVGTNINFFNEDRRFTVSGLSNNVNATSYSDDPNSQGEVSTQNGLIKTNQFAVNYSDELSDKTEISASYSYNRSLNNGQSDLRRDYVLSDSGQVYSESNTNTRLHQTHRINMRLEHNIDSNNRIIVRPNIKFRNHEGNTYFTGETVTDYERLSETENTSNYRDKDNDYDIWSYYSHKFNKPGRTFTTRINTGFHTNDVISDRKATNVFYTSDSTEILDQKSDRLRTGVTWSGNFSYTEPVGKNGMVEVEYEAANRSDDSDKLTYDIIIDEDTQMRTDRLDTVLSNVFESEIFRQEGEIGYQYRKGKVRVQVEGEYQVNQMENKQTFPQEGNLDKTFTSVLPTVRFDYDFSKNNRIEFDYDTYTSQPSVGQLQDVIDNSNPLQMRTGNPELDQSYTNRLRFKYRANFSEKEQNLFVYAASSFVSNSIVNSSSIAQEAVELAEGIILQEGSQLIEPVNVDGYWDVRSYISFGQPLDYLKSNVGVNGSVNYTKRPSIFNQTLNYINSSDFWLGLSLSSNISEKVDFNFSTRSSYNIVENSLRPNLSQNYFRQVTRLSYDWIFGDGFSYRMDVNHSLNTGLSEGFNNSAVLLNLSFGKKFLRNKRAEMSLSVYDLLAQNNNIRRNVTELYVEDYSSNVLQRYVMLNFTYNLRHFNKGTTEDDYHELYN